MGSHTSWKELSPVSNCCSGEKVSQIISYKKLLEYDRGFISGYNKIISTSKSSSILKNTPLRSFEG